MELDKKLDSIEFGPKKESIHSLKQELDNLIAYEQEHHLDECDEDERAAAPSFRPTYRDVPIDGFKVFLARKYADTHSADWDVLIADHETGDTLEAFFRLLHEYVASSDKKIVSPYRVDLNVDWIFGELEKAPGLYIGTNNIHLLRIWIKGYELGYFEGYTETGAKKNLDNKDPSWWTRVPQHNPGHKRMYETIVSYRTWYCDAPFDEHVISNYLAKHYGDTRDIDWAAMISEHNPDPNERIPTFFHLLREFAAEWKEKNALVSLS